MAWSDTDIWNISSGRIENFLIPHFITQVTQVHLSQVRMIEYPTKSQVFKKDYGFLPHDPIILRLTTARLSHSAIPPSSNISLKPTCIFQIVMALQSALKIAYCKTYIVTLV
jgi:hypothetical protein